MKEDRPVAKRTILSTGETIIDVSNPTVSRPLTLDELLDFGRCTLRAPRASGGQSPDSQAEANGEAVKLRESVARQFDAGRVHLMKLIEAGDAEQAAIFGYTLACLVHAPAADLAWRLACQAERVRAGQQSSRGKRSERAEENRERFRKRAQEIWVRNPTLPTSEVAAKIRDEVTPRTGALSRGSSCRTIINAIKDMKPGKSS